MNPLFSDKSPVEMIGWHQKCCQTYRTLEDRIRIWLANFQYTGGHNKVSVESVRQNRIADSHLGLDDEGFPISGCFLAKHWTHEDKKYSSCIKAAENMERAPTIELPKNGAETLVGRSETTHHVLSENLFISRVHVRARYTSATPRFAAEVQIECLGLNDMRIYFQEEEFRLTKGGSFKTAQEDVNIWIEVQEEFVLVIWPSKRRALLGT